jgi:hypothetical protein
MARRLDWRFAFGWLVLAACLEFASSWLLSPVGPTVSGGAPTVVVALAFLLLVGPSGYFATLFIARRGKVIAPPSVRRAVGAGALALPVLGVWLVLGGTSVFLAGTGTMTVIAAVVLAIGWLKRRRNAGDPLLPYAVWMFGVCGFVTLACCLYLVCVPVVSTYGGSVDSVPMVTLKFVSSYEPRLDQLVPLAEKATECTGCISGSRFPSVPGLGKASQVCAGKGFVSFSASGNSGYSYLDSKGGGGDACQLHLYGAWWEETQNTWVNEEGTCPTDFTYLGP